MVVVPLSRRSSAASRSKVVVMVVRGQGRAPMQRCHACSLSAICTDVIRHACLIYAACHDHWWVTVTPALGRASNLCWTRSRLRPRLLRPASLLPPAPAPRRRSLSRRRHGRSLRRPAPVRRINTTGYACIHDRHRRRISALLLVVVDRRQLLLRAVPCAHPRVKYILSLGVRHVGVGGDRGH